MQSVDAKSPSPCTPLTNMASKIDRVIQELRRRIVSGVLEPGARLVELQYSAELQVSRTPLRIAFGELEKEGLLERLPSRGFRVCATHSDAVSDAIDVRGALEALAAERAAEIGVTEALMQRLRTCVQEGRAVIDQSQHAGDRIDASCWMAMNARFHALLVQASGNTVLGEAIAVVAKVPMAGAGTLRLSGSLPALELPLLARAQQDHEDLLGALAAREGARAAALVREHARRSRENKRALLNASMDLTL